MRRLTLYFVSACKFCDGYEDGFSHVFIGERYVVA